MTTFSLLHEAMYKYNKTQDSTCDPSKLLFHFILRLEAAFISTCGHISKKTVSFEDIVHFIDEENNVTYVDFDCEITFYPEAPTKFRQINREQKNISTFFGKPKCIPGNDQHNCYIDDKHTSNTFLNPYNLWDMHPTALKSHNRTNDRDSMSNQ